MKISKKRQFNMTDVAVLVVTVALVGGGLWVRFHGEGSSDIICKTIGKEHILSLANDVFTPSNLELNRCDSIKVVNTERTVYDLAFGEHEQHISYPGFTRQLLRQNEYFILVAEQAGTYTLHEHIRDIARIVIEIKDN